MKDEKIIGVVPIMVEKPCFVCDGTGTMCNICGESQSVCDCDEENTYQCENCNGTGRSMCTVGR